MIEVMNVADDLTGALEVAALWARHGSRATVVPNYSTDEFGLPLNCDALVVNTDSRHLEAKQAAQRARRWAELAREQRIRYLFKKTDSTLRGNIAVELEAALEGFQARLLTYVPAYPKMGRTCQDGQLLVHGKPLMSTTFKSDPLNPVGEGNVVALLRSATRLPVLLVKMNSDLAAAVSSSDHPGILVCDADSDIGLSGIAQQLSRSKALFCTAGPAGFASALAEVLTGRGKLVESSHTPKPWLGLCGSLHDVADQQLSQLKSVGIEPFELPLSDLLSQEAGVPIDTPCMASAIKVARERGGVFLKTPTGAEAREKFETYRKEKQLSVEQASQHLIHQGGAFVRVLAESFDASLLITVGGDTTLGVLEAFGNPLLQAQGEYLPGIPCSNFCTQGRTWTLASKAGGFGSENTLVNLLQKIASVTT